MPTWGGEDGASARVELADLLFELDRPADAHAQLDLVRRERPSSTLPYHCAAELLEERSELQDALTWFNMAVARLTDRELAELKAGTGFSYAAGVVGGRRRVRQALGIPADELDESGVDAPFRSVAPDAFAAFDASRSFDDVPSAFSGEAAGRCHVRVLFWLRGEVGRAHQEWPQLVEHGDADAVLREREFANRELSERGVARITMVPLTVARLTDFAATTGGDPAEESTRRGCMERILEEGGGLPWPPGRNAPCWCGSNVKYKKCCGRP